MDNFDLKKYLAESVEMSDERPVLIDRYLHNAIEVDVDLVSDGKEVIVAGIMEHIERAGVHSGDSSSCLPPATLSPYKIKQLKEAAEEGHVEAMAELGLCYELGCGVEQNDEEALDWYTRAANLGHVTSKFSVGEAFEEARGVPQSDHEACLWYYRAALAGDEDSKKSLRRLYDIARIVVPGVADLVHG